MTADRPTRTGPAALMDDFVHDTNWGAESMSDFLRAWQAYPEDVRRAARGLTGFRRLSDALNDQIDQEKALVDLGFSEDNVHRFQRLTAFAQALDVPVRALNGPKQREASPSLQEDREPETDSAPHADPPTHSAEDSSLRPPDQPQGWPRPVEDTGES